MKHLIHSVLKKEDKRVSIPFTPIGMIEEILESYGVDTNDHTYQTTGWEIEFQYDYEYCGSKFRLSGSLHYGGMKFSIIE